MKIPVFALLTACFSILPDGHVLARNVSSGASASTSHSVGFSVSDIPQSAALLAVSQFDSFANAGTLEIHASESYARESYASENQARENQANKNRVSESQVIENEATSSDHPSFSARYRYRHQASKIVLDEAHVLFSHLGLRVEQRIDDSASAFIANFAEDKFWFIDRKRQLVHTVPVIATQNGSVDDFLSSMHYSAGFIELSPCLDLDRTSGSTETWQGLTVQRWTCLYEGKPVEEQWFASSPGVVVRAQSSDGFLRELTDIRNRETYPENFQPPLHYRSVSIDELLSPSAVIGKYVE